jgi:PKHD-type hydroxylase
VTSFHHDRPDAFTPAECEAIVDLATARGLEPATVLGAHGDEVVGERRRASRCEVARDAASEWIFARLDALFAQAAERFGLVADPVFEPVQVVRYGPGDHFRTWHTDAGLDRIAERQVSLSVELSDPGEHDGGTLEIAPATVGQARTLPRGGARLFPSRALHRVTPVTRGERWALVAWTGKAPD